MTKRVWQTNGCAVVSEPKSGTRTLRFPFGNIIYCETPRTSPDGKRFVVLGSDGVYVCDIETMSYTRIGCETATFNTSYNEYVHLARMAEKPDEPDRVYRVSLTTLEREPVVEICDLPNLGGGKFVAVAPDSAYLIYATRGPGVCQIVRVETRDASWQVIVEESDSLRHEQVEPCRGDLILIQQNRGSKIDEHGNETVLVDPEKGATHFIVNADGTNRQSLPVGPPYTLTCSGHSCWIGNTQRVALAVAWNHNEFNEPNGPVDWSLDSRYPGSSLFTVAPGDGRPTPVPTPDHRFFHVSASRCGKYFVCNSVPTRKGPTDIVIGNFETGRYKVFVHDCCCYARSVWPCSLPYLTADNRHVIYREKEDPTVPDYGGFTAYAAAVPDGFLHDLDL